MSNQDLSCHLQRIDPARNMRRFYVLSVERDLLGDALLVRRWGRIGTFGQLRKECFPSLREAEKALQAWRRAKLRKGYC